jgi:hypothetical protein
MAEAGQAGTGRQMLFYKSLEALAAERHRRVGVNRIDRPFKFLAGANAVPITVHEFDIACLSYPLIFAGAEKSAMAVMGARVGENVFVTPQGDIDPEAYLPAYVRRYPFALASEAKGERMIVCIDRGAPMVADGGDIPLFKDDRETQYTLDAIEFCKQFEGFRQGTEIFTKRITDYQLWETKTFTLTLPNEDGSPASPVKVADYFAVSESALAALPLEKLGVLREEGWLAPIYAHLFSLLLWPKILKRSFKLAARQPATPR